MRDLLDNEINPVTGANAHILLLGKSGYGKTYQICRLVEEKVKEEKNVLVIDFSGSYSESELLRHGFYENVKKIVFSRDVLCLPVFAKIPEDEAAGLLCEFFMMSCGLKSGYVQKGVLREASKTAIKRGLGYGGFLGPAVIWEVLMEKYRAEDQCETVGKVLGKIEKICGSNWIELIQNESERCENHVVVWQISDVDAEMQVSLVSFVLSVVWNMSKRRECPFDVIVLDELEIYSSDRGNPLKNLIRQGRKFGMELILGTQYLQEEREKVRLLMQSDTKFFFRPTNEDAIRIARTIDSDKQLEYEKILKNLQIGQALFCGRYKVEQGEIISDKPIIVQN